MSLYKCTESCLFPEYFQNKQFLLHRIKNPLFLKYFQNKSFLILLKIIIIRIFATFANLCYVQRLKRTFQRGVSSWWSDRRFQQTEPGRYISAIYTSLGAKFYYAQTTLVLVRWWHHITVCASGLFVANRRSVTLNPSFTRDRRSLRRILAAPPTCRSFSCSSSNVTSSSSVGIKFQNAEIFKFTNFCMANYIYFFVSLRFARFANFELITRVRFPHCCITFAHCVLQSGNCFC